MNIDSISGNSRDPMSQSSTATAPEKTLGKDQFLRLLMAQMGNQDPTAPMDSTAFIAQLAQFATLELQQSTNAQMEALLVAQAANNQVTTAQLVGKDVSYRSESFSYLEGENHEFSVDIAQPIDEITVTIEDTDGNIVRTMHLGSQGSGSLDVNWDGLDDEGNPVEGGDYQIVATGHTNDGEALEFTVQHHGHIDGISFSNGYPELLVGDETVGLPDVVEITDVENSTNGANSANSTDSTPSRQLLNSLSFYP